MDLTDIKQNQFRLWWRTHGVGRGTSAWYCAVCTLFILNITVLLKLNINIKTVTKVMIQLCRQVWVTWVESRVYKDWTLDCNFELRHGIKLWFWLIFIFVSNNCLKQPEIINIFLIFSSTSQWLEYSECYCPLFLAAGLPQPVACWAQLLHCPFLPQSQC